MHQLPSRISRFFTGVRLFLPLLPNFVWVALGEMVKSKVEYWRNSQSTVDGIADQYMRDAMNEEGMTSEYDVSLYRVCYSIASFLYLLSWLTMSWLTVEGLRLLTSWVF